MRSDAGLLLGIFVFIFIAWVATGGPSRPISFAGPYITPITNVGVRSEGYGTFEYKGLGSSAQSIYNAANNQNSINSIQQSINDAKETTAYSVAHGSVRLRAGNLQGTDAESEYLILSVSGRESVDVTGWTIMSTSTDKTVTIPRGRKVPHLDGSGQLENIVLAGGEQIILSTGRSPLGGAFKENKCGGYLASTYNFIPSLNSYQCPDPSNELRTYYTADATGYVACKKYLQNVYGCTALRNAPDNLPSSCTAFMNNRLTYEGCLLGHVNDTNFDGNTWHVYFEKTKKLWSQNHANIYLLDRAGRVVDVYTY